MDKILSNDLSREFTYSSNTLVTQSLKAFYPPPTPPPPGAVNVQVLSPTTLPQVKMPFTMNTLYV